MEGSHAAQLLNAAMHVKQSRQYACQSNYFHLASAAIYFTLGLDHRETLTTCSYI